MGIGEEWRIIPGYEGYYEASSCGRIRSIDRTVTNSLGRHSRIRGQILRPFLRSKRVRYPTVRLYRDGVSRKRSVHSLVLLAFVGPPPAGLEIRHLNGNSTDSRLANLVYGTHAENMLDAAEHGTMRRSGGIPRRIVRKIRPQSDLCPKGHRYQSIRAPGAECRTCATERMRRWRAARRSVMNG